MQQHTKSEPYGIAFFEDFPCDVELWSATNAMKFVFHYEKIK